MTDRALRRHIRRSRRQLGQREQRLHAEAVCQRLLSSGLLRSARRIALYQAVDGELDPNPIRVRLTGRYRWYLPVLRPHTQGRLWFVRDRAQRLWRPNRFGILEPSVRGSQIAAPQGLHLILVPLVGFDAECHRIGMGAGFYDRSLAFLRSRRHWQRPRLIGLAHECQRIDRIEPEPWDVQLDAVVTERNLYQCKAQLPAQPPRSIPANSR